jgi:hypothetical protein
MRTIDMERIAGVKQRGVERGIRRFWRDYERRNGEPSMYERIDALERSVDALASTVNGLLVVVREGRDG